ncbi:hypothetical protein MNBD_GAMMA12-922, partial [hydrothermal vent metagenome]
MKTIKKSISLLLTTTKTNDEISEVVGDISSYTVWHYRRILSRKKYEEKSLEKILNSNL